MESSSNGKNLCRLISRAQHLKTYKTFLLESETCSAYAADRRDQFLVIWICSNSVISIFLHLQLAGFLTCRSSHMTAFPIQIRISDLLTQQLHITALTFSLKSYAPGLQ